MVAVAQQPPTPSPILKTQARPLPPRHHCCYPVTQVDEKLGRINLSLLPYGQAESPRASPVAAIKDVSHLLGADPTEFRKGTVSAVAEYGLFVNIEGVDGLLHISKMRCGGRPALSFFSSFFLAVFVFCFNGIVFCVPSVSPSLVYPR